MVTSQGQPVLEISAVKIVHFHECCLKVAILLMVALVHTFHFCEEGYTQGYLRLINMKHSTENGLAAGIINYG